MVGVEIIRIKGSNDFEVVGVGGWEGGCNYFMHRKVYGTISLKTFSKRLYDCAVVSA